MNELLRHLLNQLDAIGIDHEELYDTECRERMSDAVMGGFVRGTGTSVLPDDLGLYSHRERQPDHSGRRINLKAKSVPNS